MKTGSNYWWELWRQAATTGGNYEDRQLLLVGKADLSLVCTGPGKGRGHYLLPTRATLTYPTPQFSHPNYIPVCRCVLKKIYNIEDKSKILYILKITIPYISLPSFAPLSPDKYMFIMYIIQYSVYQILSLSYEGGGGAYRKERPQRMLVVSESY